jgi:hypothetical protein
MDSGMLVATELRARDVAAARAFYAAVAGWTYREEAGGTLACLQGRERIAMIRPLAGAADSALPDHWLPVFGATDLAATLAAAVANGGKLVEAEDGLSHVREPGGAVSGLAALDGSETPAPVSDRRHGHLWWRSLNVRDAAAARSFHENVNGWRFRRLPMQDASYLLGFAGGEPTAGIYPMSGPLFDGLPDNWLVYLAVDDCDKAVAAAVAAGGRVIHPARPIRMVCRLAVVAGPGGAPVALAEPKAGFLQERTLPLLRLIRPR